MNLTVDLEAFATEQGDRQAREEHRLMGSARYALRRWGKDGWFDTLLARAERLLRAAYREQSRRRGSEALDEQIAHFLSQSERMLEKTKEPTKDTLESQARAIAASLSTGAINAAMDAAAHDDDTPDTELERVWVSMEDDKVRPSHAAANGQVRDMDHSFDVGGHKLHRPGDTSAPIEEWINCRCLMAIRKREDQEAVVAAAVEEKKNTGIVIVAIPADDDPVREWSSEDVPHVTTIWLGTTDAADLDYDAIREEVAAVVEGVAPFTMAVTGRQPLGDDEADVLMLEASTLGDLRNDLLDHTVIRSAHDGAEQFPEWTPHLTLGYPDSPTPKPDEGAPNIIRIDRLALWAGDEHSEFALNGEAQDMDRDKDNTEQPPPPLAEAERLTSDPIPWHGVLAPEATLSGDGRRFSAGSLRRRPLPQPLKWQKVDDDGHRGSITVARIDRMVRVGNEIRGAGEFLTSVPETDEAVGLIAEGGIRGVSIDADDARMEMQTGDGENLDDILESLEPGGEGVEIDFDDVVTEFTSGRICAATLCAIPAFKEAYVALGEAPEGFLDGEELAEEDAPVKDDTIAAAVVTLFAISEKAWDGSASRFTDEEWKRSCTVHLADTLNKSDHKLPIKEPNGDLSRAGVHAAAARVNQVDAPESAISSARSQLRSAYKTLGEDPPEGLAVEAEEFVKTEDGPGWITHPVDTDRLRDYWTKGAGAAKIAWGTPGDFNRCRAAVAEYVKPQHLNGYCANRHYDALGFWPSSHKASAKALAASAAADLPEETMAPAINLVAAAEPPVKAPMEWFENPNLVGPSPIVVTEEGRIFGHLAQWGVCHIGINGLCREAPPSASDYAYFRTGSYVTDKGQIPVGVLTMDTGHADLSASARIAMAHYDDTGAQAAYVNIGEDSHGIWVAGVIRAGMTDSEVTAMRASALSGDWRDIGGALELVAALHVNTPGFPVPHTALAASAGHQTSLVAAGVVQQPKTAEERITVEKIAAAVLDAMESREASRKMKELAAERAKMEMAELAASRTGD